MNSIQSDFSEFSCPVYDPFDNRLVLPNEGRDVFSIALRGFNFGPARSDGKGPLVFSGTGTSRARSSVIVRTHLTNPFGMEVAYDIPCFEEWNHDVVRFVVPHPGNVSIIISSEGVDGAVYRQESNVVAFQYDSPSLRSNDKDSTRPIVSANGTSVLRIVGRYLFELNSTVVTRVTIGGTSAGFAVPVEDVAMGYLPAEAGTRRLAASDPNQYLDITVPVWQGERVPLVIFKVFASGTTAGSDPFYVDIRPPQATSVLGSTGTVTRDFDAVYARTDGTTRVRITGTDVGRVGTRIVFLNGAISRISGEFLDCTRDLGFVECTAPAGVGASDDTGSPLRIALLQPGMMCDANDQSSQAPAWNRCLVVADESHRDVAPEQGWLFKYEAPVVLSVRGSSPSGGLPSSGGLITVTGYNFGHWIEDVVAWLQPRPSSVLQRVDLMAAPGTNITTDVSSGLQSLQLLAGAGLGQNWTLTFSIRNQEVDQSSFERRQALLFSFDPPRLTNLSVSTGLTSGGYNVTILGENFGTPEVFSTAGRCVGCRCIARSSCSLRACNVGVVVCRCS